VQEFFELARKILAEQLDLKPEQIQMSSTFDEIEADSIDIVETIMALEDIYEVEFPEDDLEGYPTIGSLVEALYHYLDGLKK